jgi:beta-lactamase class D
MLAPANPAFASLPWDTTRIAGYFREYHLHGCFVLCDLKDSAYYRYNAARCDSGFLPASTFKIFNALAGLETGVIRDENHTRKWDGIRRAVPEWNSDQTMKTAMQYSVVWYYQQVAREIGPERMSSLLRNVRYGNEDISAGIDTFWLTGKFAISADEQVEFLRRLYRDALPFSLRNMHIVKHVLVTDSTQRYILRSKTGLTRVGKGRSIGWWVGYLDQDGDIYLFAMNGEGESTNPRLPAARKEISLRIFNDLGLAVR